MRAIRLLVLSIVALFLLVTAISLFIPSRVRISKAINVKASQQTVWRHIDNMGEWKNWNPFFQQVQQSMITDIDSSQGMLTAMTVNGTRISWQTMVDTEHVAAMERPGRLSVLNGWKNMKIAGSDSTTIQWYMDFHLHWYPWEKFGSLLFEKSYSPKMEQGLSNLKKMVEADRTSQ